MRSTFAILMLVQIACCAGADDSSVLEFKKKSEDNYRFVLSQTGRDLAITAPNAWQGNVNIISPNGEHCGVTWPHFLMMSDGKWLSDKVESKGLRLLAFETLNQSGPVIGYRGEWKFRDYFVSSETHFAWYEPTSTTQVHFVRTELEILEELNDITTTWVEFMTRENSYTTVAAKMKDGEVITVDISKTGRKRNMHYWDGEELADDGWVTIYGARHGQDGCVVLVPLKHSPDPIRPRINNGHVDNIEIHMLDARKCNTLKKGEKLFLEYLLIAGPDKSDWRWIDPAVERARAFMRRSDNLLR